jgi:hypothetical protein
MGGTGMSPVISTEMFTVAYPYKYAELKGTKNRKEE